MNRIEEELWNYIDGECTADQKLEITEKIATDPRYRKIYEELLEVNKSLAMLDFEEPSMSFTRNVMEMVNVELPPVALKTKIDNRIVYAIGALFAVCILTVVGYAISISSFTFEMPKLTMDFTKVITPTTIQIFVLVDVALALIYLDSYLRKKNRRRESAIKQ